MAQGRRVFDRRFRKCAAQVGGLEVRVVAKPTASARSEQHPSFDLPASYYLTHRILERRDGDVPPRVGVVSRIIALCSLHSRYQFGVVRIVERSSREILASRPALAVDARLAPKDVHAHP